MILLPRWENWGLGFTCQKARDAKWQCWNFWICRTPKPALNYTLLEKRCEWSEHTYSVCTYLSLNVLVIKGPCNFAYQIDKVLSDKISGRKDSRKLAFLPPPAGMQTGTASLEGNLETFNGSQRKIHILCADLLHPLQAYSPPLSFLSSAQADWCSALHQRPCPCFLTRLLSRGWGRENDRDPSRKRGRAGGQFGYLFSGLHLCWVTALARTTHHWILAASSHRSLPLSQWV